MKIGDHGADLGKNLRMPVASFVLRSEKNCDIVIDVDRDVGKGGISAVGSALHSHCRGHGFESRMLHILRRSEPNLRRIGSGFLLLERLAVYNAIKGKIYRRVKGYGVEKEKGKSGAGKARKGA